MTAPSPSSAKPLTFEAVAPTVDSALSFHLDSMEQVARNSFNWRGPADASLRGDIGFAPGALVLSFVTRDDVPFYQARLHPARPEWWQVPYGADGVDVLMDDPTSAARHVRFALNLSSAATRPSVDLISTYVEGLKPGTIGSATLQLSDANESGGTRLQAAIPYVALADLMFFARPLRVTLRLHDVDGGMSTYCMMQATMEKK